jgi:branched-chain amino acid transport system permease protein
MAVAMLALCLPQVFRGGGAHALMSLAGIAIVLALSYNLLLGGTGLLSFGHAVYYGLGAFATAHLANHLAATGTSLPLPLLPAAGGAAGLAAAAVFGWFSTRRSGTAFAMISLGLGELVGACSLILRSFFGGEGGVSTNRTALGPWMGFSFGPQVEVTYLIIVWCLVSAWAMHFLTQTPLGRIANAVRDNAERVPFLCYSTHQVRFRMFCLAGLFAGVAGSLAALQYEIATTSLLGTQQSGQVLLMVIIGGTAFFVGPVVGAILMTVLQVFLSDYTGAWMVYLGLLFTTMVIFAPNGLAGLVLMHQPLARARLLRKLLPSYGLALPAGLLLIASLVILVETVHHRLVKMAEGPLLDIAGLSIDTESCAAWLAIGALLAFALAAVLWAAPRAAAAFASACNEAALEGEA